MIEFAKEDICIGKPRALYKICQGFARLDDIKVLGLGVRIHRKRR